MKAFVPEPDQKQNAFRLAMRNLVGGVTVITSGSGESRVGLTATSVSSLSMEPPSIIVCINRASSTLPVLTAHAAFGVNILADHQREIADRFAGKHGLRGEARFTGSEWVTLATGAPLLVGALAALDCRVAHVTEWHTHAVIVGSVEAVHLRGGLNPLVYWRGDYDRLEATEPHLQLVAAT